MRKGFHANLLVTNGEIVAIGTGSDACAEHEWGSKPMQAALCAGQTTAEADDAALIAALRKGTPVTYPELLARKRLNKNLDKVVFCQGTEAGEPVAVFGYNPRDTVRLDHPELRLYSGESITGAWSERGFALKVKGATQVEMLARFAAKVQAGDGLFAGLFLTGQREARLSGVIVALESALTDDQRSQAAVAQSRWELELRLQAKSRKDELLSLLHAADRRTQPHIEVPGYIWPVWLEEDQDIAYALNPGYQVDAAYWGPYDFDQLKSWILAEKKFKLVPLARK